MHALSSLALLAACASGVPAAFPPADAPACAVAPPRSDRAARSARAAPVGGGDGADMRVDVHLGAHREAAPEAHSEAHTDAYPDAHIDVHPDIHPDAQLYVASDGADTNDGSAAAPFRTIQRGADAATAGATVHVGPGTYRENITTSVHGTSAARIRYVSDIKWGAHVVGSGSGAMWTNQADYTDIVGFDISGSGRLGIYNVASFAVLAGNHVHHLSVSGGCTGGGGAGINHANYNASDNDVIGNVVHDIGSPGSCNGVHGIYLANLRGRIVNNVVYRAAAFGIHLWHAADQAIIANNTVFANGAKGMGGGIVIGSGDAPGGVVLNHTKVINNIVYNNPGVSIGEYCYAGQDCTGPDNTIANNLVFGNGSAISLRAGKPSGTISADPQFVNFQANGEGNYRLKRSSPAIDKGLTQSAPAIDIDDVARPRGAAPDLGAYESF